MNTQSLHQAIKLTVATLAILGTCVCRADVGELQEGIEEVLAEEGLTGVAWTLLHDNGSVTLGSAGVQDNQTGTAFAPETRLHVGSVTKTLLATGVLRLATEGRIDIDAPAIRYLPGVFSGTPPPGFSDITVRHLLDHTAGLNDAHMWQMFSERAGPDVPLIAAFPNPEDQLRVRSKPGTQVSYSNMGYTLLGMVVETVAGDRYETYLDKHVLGPLGMHSSTFAFTTQAGEDADPMLAWGHVDDGSRYAASPMFLRPAGQFTSTTADLAQFAKFLLSDGSLNGEIFIDEALMRSRGKPVGTDAAAEGLVAGYALGVGRRDRHGVISFCHAGNVIGFVAMLCIYPDDGKAFAYSVNTDSETANYGRLDSLFISALQVASAKPPRTAALSPEVSQWHGYYALSPNRFAMFEYLDTVFGSIRIAGDNGMLTLTPLFGEARQLRPVDERLFSAGDRTTTSHVLLRDDQGEHLVSDGFRTYRKISIVWLAAHWTSTLLGLAGLAWVFLAGLVSLLRYRSGTLQQALAPAFFSLLLLFVPVPFFMSQSFMALGDFTLASALLAVVTALLPIGMLLTIGATRKSWKDSRIIKAHGVAAVLVLQWCAVLLKNGMLPLRLWL